MITKPLMLYMQLRQSRAYSMLQNHPTRLPTEGFVRGIAGVDLMITSDAVRYKVIDNTVTGKLIRLSTP